MCFLIGTVSQMSDIILHHSHFSKFILQIVAVNWKKFNEKSDQTDGSKESCDQCYNVGPTGK